MSGAVILFQDFSAQDVSRHEVGGELNAAERQVQNLTERADQQGLAQAGHALHQHVATRQQADQELLDHRLLPDDGLA